ncbi:MAG TPA: response regulator [Burkholderiaceae bacterium]|nr:response regulator [Burkholderiaceae bacterium]
MNDNRRVIIADDLEDNVACLALLLRRAGCDVLEFTRGDRLLDSAIRFRPHAVLVDLYLGGASGLEIARSMRQHPQLRTTLLAAISGWVDESSRRLAADAGFDRFYEKPVNPQEVIDLVLSIDRRQDPPLPWPALAERRRRSPLPQSERSELRRARSVPIGAEG